MGGLRQLLVDSPNSLGGRARARREALAEVDGTELIDRKEMTELFPSSVIENEMVIPFLPAKSLIAVRR